jgi:hypothetical protein
MIPFRKFIRIKRPGAGFEGTNELRKEYIRRTPGQIDPIVNEKPTPHLEEDLCEVKTFKNNSSWVLFGGIFQHTKTGSAEHPDLFPNVNFMGRQSAQELKSEYKTKKTNASAWGRIDHDNRMVHIITQNGGLTPNVNLRGKRLEDDVFSRLEAVKHLKQNFPGYMIHHAGNNYRENPDESIMTHSYGEHEKHLTDMLKSEFVSR